MKKQFCALIVPALAAAALAACGGSTAPETAPAATATAAANAGEGGAFSDLLGTTAAPETAAESQEAPVTETTAQAAPETAAAETSEAAAETSEAAVPESSAMPHDGGGLPAEDVLESDAAALIDAAAANAAANVRSIELVGDSYMDFCGENEGDNYVVYGEYTIPQVTVSSSFADQYPQLTKALDRFTADQLNSREALKENLKKNHEELGEYGVGYELEDTTTVIYGRSDSMIVNFILEHYLYLGGAHPYVERYSVNLDPATGKEIALDSIVPDKDALQKKLLEKLSMTEYVTEQQFLDRFKEVPFEKEAWCLDGEGLHFYYDDYAFGSYAVGALDAVIPYGELEGILAPQYTVLPAARIEQFPPEGRTIGDLFGEDAFADVSITYHVHPAEWDPATLMYDGFTVTVLDAPLTVDNIPSGFEGENLEIYGMEPELYRTADGIYYLYMYCSGAEMGDDVEIVSLNDPKRGLSWVGRLPGVYRGYETVPYDRIGAVPQDDERPECFLQIISSDPDRFRLFERSDAFGTGSVYKTYRVGKDGMPESGDDVFYCPIDWSTNVPVSKQEMMFEGVDPATGQPNGKRVRVPAGTSFSKIRTDKETFVDCFIGGDLSNQVRLRLNMNEWPFTVNGIPEEDAFEDVMYAG